MDKTKGQGGDRNEGESWKADLRSLHPQWAEEKAENQPSLHASPPNVQEVVCRVNLE